MIVIEMRSNLHIHTRVFNIGRSEPMYPDLSYLAQWRFRGMPPTADQVADAFFARLFQTAPELRALFPVVLGPQRHRLMATLAFAINSMDEFEDMLPMLRALGAEHKRSGRRNAHFAAYCTAMLYTLEARLGEKWAPAHRDAWAEFFGALVQCSRAEAENTAAAA